MQSVLLCVSTVLLLQPTLSMAFSDSEDRDDSGMARSRRGWSMMRLGRGLQMLRLGKRTSSPLSPPSSSSSSLESRQQATPEEMRALLSALLDESRHEFRRQPPLPRYGRELDVAQDNADDLYSLLGDGAGLPLHYSRLVHQGRFKRSAENRFQDPVSDYARALEDSRIRAVALPRIGRYLGQLYKFRPVKAVPAPRIGRQETGSEGVRDTQSSGKAAPARDSKYLDQQRVSDVAADRL